MSFKKIKNSLFLLLLAACAQIFAFPATADPLARNIFYLNSYHNDDKWSQQIYSGLTSALNAGPHKIHIQQEDLDSKKFNYRDTAPLMYALFKEKFRNRKFDLIVASDNAAVNFLMEYGDELFPGVPVVFCGYNAPPGTFFPGKNITGVLESLDFQANLELALRLQPGLKRVTLISSETFTGNAAYMQFQQAMAPFAGRLEFDAWSGRDMADLLQKVKAQDPETTAFYFFPINTVINGRYYPAEEVLDYVRESTRAKIYSNWEFLLGHGVLGGKMSSGAVHGKAAAAIALRVLNGEDPADIPIESESLDSYVFDYDEVRKDNILLSMLPQGSDFVNMPPEHYSFSRRTVWLIAGSLALLTIVLGVMLGKTLHRRRVETRGRERLALLRLLMDTVPVPIYSEDIHGRINECNVAFEKYMGLSRGRILNGAASGASPALKALNESARLIKAKPESSGTSEMIITDASGSKHSAVLHHSAYFNHEGELSGFVGAIIDYTDQEKAARELSVSQSMLMLVLDNIPQLVYWKDNQHNFMGVNRAFSEFFEIEAAQVIGRNTRDFFTRHMEPPSRSAQIAAMDGGVMVEGRPLLNYRAQFQVKNKTVVFSTSRIPLLDAQGRALGVLVTAEDISERLLLEQQLIQSQKMEAIGTLSGGIAHDFNNILTSIINSIELVLEDMEDGSPAHEDLVRALRAANQGSRLVRQILSFSRSSVEGFVSTDIKEAINDALYLMKASLPRNIQLWKNITNLPSFMLADPIQIHQVVLNLCTNSSHALKDSGGVIDVSLAHTYVNAQQAADMGVTEGEYALLSVTDNGPGISQENIDKIFVPFFTTKGKGEGTGLGLPVVHGIVKAHKGAIQVFSIPWQKTVFNVFLPLDQAARAQAQKGAMLAPDAPEAQSMQQSKPRMIFVEDDESQLYIVPKAMQGLGYRVSAFMSGEEAIREICANPQDISILVSDFDMPRLNGLDLARAAQQCAPELPVILVSGRGLTPEKAAACRNVREIIQKPYNRDTLDQAIRRILGSRSA